MRELERRKETNIRGREKRGRVTIVPKGIHLNTEHKRSESEETSLQEKSKKRGGKGGEGVRKEGRRGTFLLGEQERHRR